MDFDTIFRETRSGRSVRQIIVLPDADVSEPDTVSEDELDHTFQQSNSSSDDEVIEEDDASTDARRKSYTWRRRPFNPKTEPFTEADEEIPSVLRPIEYFRMYFTAQLLSHIAFETNRKATQSLCGRNGFVHDFWMCDGMAPKVENSIGFFAADVVMKLCETLPKHKGYKVFFDNYFAFLELQEALLRDGIYSVATIRSNRLRGCPVMPSNELKRKGRGATDFCCTRDNKLCVVKWFDNREVILTSTYKCVDPVEPVRRWDKRQRQFIDVPCPQIVKEYNQFMGGVDLTGMLISLYRIDHKCRKWHRRVFFWAIHVALTNSWLKYRVCHRTLPSSLHEM
ncbi:PiggyBac transposable element-derived protein 1 [Trichinella pseudospiralis]|uniref:PiggyBac transposable element-derived protein 1 n=1 Tax=Trichinella pseudospiralis TaxID=6337 RepID=A0A0V1E8L4_TRIPS|nr:PiggyBac transposable element-derived protein 1 [Trichinella pseudospiralis]